MSNEDFNKAGGPDKHYVVMQAEKHADGQGMLSDHVSCCCRVETCNRR